MKSRAAAARESPPLTRQRRVSRAQRESKCTHVTPASTWPPTLTTWSCTSLRATLSLVRCAIYLSLLDARTWSLNGPFPHSVRTSHPFLVFSCPSSHSLLSHLQHGPVSQGLLDFKLDARFQSVTVSVWRQVLFKNLFQVKEGVYNWIYSVL